MSKTKSASFWLFLLLAIGSGVACFLVAALLLNIFERKQEAREPFVRLVEVTELTTDPKPWGVNWPQHFDGYKATAGDEFYGGSSAMPQSKLEQQPWLRRLYAGYAFSLDYREARGHAYMLHDQSVTERVTKKPQSGACLHCHASVIPTYRRIGLESMNQPADEAALAESFNWPAVMKGFEEVSTRPYHEVLQEVAKTPDGTPGDGVETLDMPQAQGDPAAQAHAMIGNAHPVSCVDCHDPESMAIRVTRPGFVQGIRALAEGDAPVKHLPSIEKWRQGSRKQPYDPNLDASRQELRSYVCGQCHVEYYCANKMTLTFPWANGLRADDEEQTWDEQEFPDGSQFHDYIHGETGAPVYKVQHPEFELWSQGIHAASGVSCADCHMPYQRSGAMKISSHDVSSPMMRINSACQTCHKVPEDELESRVDLIQLRTTTMLERAAEAMTDMLDAIREAKAGSASEEQLTELYDLQRKAMWRIDYISSENSKGFHASQEAMRILGESIDYSRQAQAKANRLRAPEPPEVDLPVEPVQGVTPTEAAPIDAPEEYLEPQEVSPGENDEID
jgi:nitrite reductase (cytochrome c-552)